MEDLQPIRAKARSFETERLILRPYAADDFEPMAAMFGDREVTAHTLLGLRDRAQTGTILDGYRAFLAERGYGMLAILDKADGRYLGEVGLFVTPMGPLALRYALVREAWGRGYATEASIPVIDDCFDDLGLHRLLAGVVAANTGSLRVVEKLGFTFDSMVTASGIEFKLFAVGREDWKNRAL